MEARIAPTRRRATESPMNNHVLQRRRRVARLHPNASSRPFYYVLQREYIFYTPAQHTCIIFIRFSWLERRAKIVEQTV